MRVRSRADGKLADIDAKIRHLTAMRRTLERLATVCPTAPQECVQSLGRSTVRTKLATEGAPMAEAVLRYRRSCPDVLAARANVMRAFSQAPAEASW
jgi:hypothetical protein